MGLIKAGYAAAGLSVLFAGCGCARDPVSLNAVDTQRPRISFDAALARCGVTVADTAKVQQCMRAQGWVYRLPWQ